MSNTTKSKPTACLCGCGQPVAKALYRPGHDARHVGQTARQMVHADSTAAKSALLSSLPSDALRLKAKAFYERLIAKGTKSVNATESVVDDPSNIVVGTVKIGRWTYDAEYNESDSSLRYKTKQGEWVEAGDRPITFTPAA